MLIHLVRHAHAGSRSRWDGPDEHRPLSDKGWAQARAIGKDLRKAGIDLLWSSPYLRCRQTLEPLAERLGLEVADHDLLAEGGWGPPALDALLEAAAAGRTVAACSHGDIIPAVIDAAVNRGARLVGPGSPSKGARYECEVVDGTIVRIVHVPAPEA